MATPRKVRSLADLLYFREEAKQQGRTVVHCHGCFDIVHPGHIHHLQFAKSLGDLLVVSVSADTHVNKGVNRPLIPDDLRVASLAALECVDVVYLNPDSTAAALAAGLTGLEIGSDIGGSIRVPAHYCGVFGHKPTWALCPNYGDPATSAAAPTDIAVIGPLARSANDLGLALDAIAGPDPGDSALLVSLPPARITRLQGLRVAVWATEQGQATDSETVEKLHALADFLERAGAVVSRTARPGFDAGEAYRLYLQLLNAAWSAMATDASLATQREGAISRGEDDMSADAIMCRSVDMSHRTWLRLNERRHRLRRAWTGFFRDYDVLLCPAIATAAFRHMQQAVTWERRITVEGREMAYNDMLFWPGLIGGYHLPATVAPVGFTSAGLPLGVQIAGPVYGDRTTIAVAALLEQEFLGFTPPPDFT
jgi:amidase